MTTKKILALSAFFLTSIVGTSAAFASPFYNGYDTTNYSNDTSSYANAGPGGATAYYSNNTDYNSTNYNNSGFNNNGMLNGNGFGLSYPIYLNNNNNNNYHWNCFGNGLGLNNNGWNFHRHDRIRCN